ncbi:hypothetical protein [Natronococcus jeotgali]|uniref:Uncharacterized protein n=1 Tax=Natronococcus jeotgali DSM 18795 TaxID=1227498 RepID=L9XDL7_9EURY|nr:hypothetical protein [Natronococcus jeotgali]ELY58723.1 hypothetical protein C492_11560 [Natronococcus jeotgali DSM 18795]
MTEDEKVDIREVQSAKLRKAKGSIVVRATNAIRAAGLKDGSFRFDPYAVEEIGMVPAIGTEERIDGRTDPLASSIRFEGDGSVMMLTVPREVLEALEIDPDDIDWDNPPELNVWAGDRLIAFERPDERTVQVDRGEDSKD